MTGPIEQAGKAVGGFMDVMRQQPLSLALVVMNLALLVIFYIILIRVNDTHKLQFERQQAEQKEVRELLSKCVVPPKADLPRDVSPVKWVCSPGIHCPTQLSRTFWTSPLPLGLALQRALERAPEESGLSGAPR
jgi:hypothetical protein